MADSVFLRALILGLAYWLTVTLAVELVFPVEKIALFWPANAIAATALVFSRRKYWPVYIAVTAAAYLAGRIPSGHFPLYVYFGFCAANLIEVLIVAGLVRRFASGPVNHETLTKVLPVAMLAPFPATVVSAVMAGAFVVTAIDEATFLRATASWFVGDLAGLLLVLPALLAWLSPGAPSVKSYTREEIIERACIVAAFVAIGLSIPVFQGPDSQVGLFFPYLVFPVLIWTAIRAGIRSATIAVLAVGLVAIFLTYVGHGPFNFLGLSAFGQVVLMKVGLITITGTTVFLAVVVAERKRAVAALRESQERFRDYASTSSDYFFEMDEYLRFSYFSDRFTEIAGIAPEELLGKTRQETGIPGVDEDQWQRHLADLDGHRPFRDFVHPRTHPDGHVVYLSINGIPVFDAGGRFMGYRCTGADRTAEVEARLALEASEERNRLILQSAGEGIYGLDLKGRTTFINRTAARMVGWKPADLIGKPLHDILHHTRPDGSPFPAKECPIYAAFKDGKVHNASDEVFWRKDGSSFPVEYASTPIRKDGELVGAVVTFNDITERREAERALRESEEMLKGIQDHSPASFVVRDLEGRFVFVNRAYEKMFNVTNEEIRGKTPGEIFPKAFADTLQEFDRTVLESGRALVHEHPAHLDDDSMTLFSVRFPIHNAAGDIISVAGTAIDITERKRAEQLLRLAKEEAEVANKAKSEFLAAMSHELRTPLNAILGFADILSHREFGPPVQGKDREYVEDIRSSGEHLLSLVTDILDFTTIEAGQQSLVREALSTEEIISECKKMVAEKARTNGIELVTKVPEDPQPIYADRRAVKQILLNILSNAVKFTPEGGTITIMAKASKRNATIKIADTGKGIAADKLENLTDPFTRTARDPYLAEEGWGLGLTITKSLVELHEGTLKIRSVLGKGTTVTVTLPNGAP